MSKHSTIEELNKTLSSPSNKTKYTISIEYSHGDESQGGRYDIILKVEGDSSSYTCINQGAYPDYTISPENKKNKKVFKALFDRIGYNEASTINSLR